MTILLDPLTRFASPSNPQGEEAPAPRLWAHQARIVDVEFRVQCDSFVCNSHKGPSLSGIDPETGQLAPLFNPRQQLWQDHFDWRGAEIVGRTSVGRSTIAVLAMNDPDYLAIRASLLAEGIFPPTP